MLALFALLLPAPLFEAPTLRGALVSAYVISAQTGQVLYERNADADVVPASTLKLLVGSATLDQLGVNFSFTTTLETDGTTLYLRGGGDPLLRPSDFDDAARALTALGKTHFDALVGDDGPPRLERYPGGWSVDDLPFYYSAPPSPLSIDENALHVYVHPGAVGATPTLSVDPANTVVTIVNQATTGPARSDDTTWLTTSWDQPDTLILTGSVPADETDADMKTSILDPARATLALAGGALTRGGIAFANPARLSAAPAGTRVLWTHRSPPLSTLLSDMWLPSDNLLAESLLDALAPDRGAALERERAWLRTIGVDPATTTLSDGSGLSSYDRISARDLVTILAHDYNGPNRDIVMGALPIAGERGTLAHAFEFPPLQGKIVAKTGTVNHTHTLAGYMETPHGTLIFALMVNNWMDDGPTASGNLRAFQSTFLESFFE
jgi:D-alanyl-D-alanine carboxypeptidase/D-alanyl-D-alanine-endopeptidase (penicillin-binding protein 4)